jgi:hypothetical protein
VARATASITQAITMPTRGAFPLLTREGEIREAINDDVSEAAEAPTPKALPESSDP